MTMRLQARFQWLTLIGAGRLLALCALLSAAGITVITERPGTSTSALLGLVPALALLTGVATTTSA